MCDTRENMRIYTTWGFGEVRWMEARGYFFVMQVWRGPVGAGSECGYRGCRAVGEREAPHDAEGLRGT